MASSPRDVEREEERRLNARTLTIASAASAAAATVTSQLWIAGTWIAAALTPVLVALISEALHRPTERVARVSRAWTGERAALGSRGGRAAPEPLPEAAGASPPPPPDDEDPLPRRASGEPGPVHVYRQQRARPKRKQIAIGAVAATGAIAFVVGILALTTVDLVSGGSVGKGSGRTTAFGGGGGNGADESRDATPADDRQEDGRNDAPAEQPPEQPDAGEPAPSEPPADEPPSDTAPVPPAPETPAPGEPAPDAVP